MILLATKYVSRWIYSSIVSYFVYWRMVKQLKQATRLSKEEIEYIERIMGLLE